MKLIQSSVFRGVLCGFVCSSLGVCPAAGDEIKVRIHVPYPERLENESWTTLIARIENRSQTVLPILWSGNPDKEFTSKENPAEHTQFILQTKPHLGELGPITAFKWGNINEFADSGVSAGEAIELVSCSGLGLPKQTGEYRFALKIGPEKVIYSNWIKLTQYPAQDQNTWSLLPAEHVGTWPAGTNRLVVGRTPSGPWVFLFPYYDSGTSMFHRMFQLANGNIPRITDEPKKRQIGFSFDGNPANNIFYNTNLGISRSTPWPEGNSGADFNNKPMPVDAPSPMEFPLSLFGDGRPDKPMPTAILKITATIPVNSPPSEAAPSSSKRPLWFVAGVGIAGALFLAYVFKKRKSSG